MWDSGFGLSLIYGLVLAAACAGVVYLGKLSDRSQTLRAMYDYSGFVLGLAPIALVIWHFWFMTEDTHGRRPFTKVPVVQQDNALERDLPAGKGAGVLPVAAGGIAANKAGRVP